MSPAPKPNAQRPRVIVEWVYVQPRTLLLIGALVVTGLVAGVWWWIGRGPEDSRARAEHAIAAAQITVDGAGQVAPQAPQLITARSQLLTARSELGDHQFGRALSDAQQAERLAREVLSAGAPEPESGVRVVRADGDVRLKRAGQFEWESLNEKSVLKAGDQVRTGSGGTAQLVYFDRSIITVSPNTLLELRELYRDAARREQRVSERLEFGTVSATTQNSEGVSSIHEVATASAQVHTSQSAEFQVSHDRELGRSEVTSYQGELRLTTGGRSIDLPVSTRVAVADGHVVERTKLVEPPALTSPPDQKTFLAPSESAVQLIWARAPDAAAYHAQVSTGSAFASLAADLARVTGQTAQLPALPPGTYYWRVAAQDRHAVAGRWSEVRRFRVLGADFKDMDDHTPPTLDVSEILVVGTNAIVSGRTEAGALVWVDGERVEVSDDGKFTWVVRLREDGDNKIQVLAQDAAGNESRRLGHAYVDAY